MIINLLFTSQFMAMRNLFAWQLAGDVVKMAGWLLAILFWAKGMAKWFIVTELYFSLQYVLLAYLCVNTYGLQGACIAYFINYTSYFAAVYLIIKKEKIL
jgi:polysaccharide transporter, PST family